MTSTRKVMIITGASHGIGKAIANVFAEQNADLVLVDIDGNALISLTDSIRKNTGSVVLPLIGDLADPAFFQTIIKSAVEKFERIDGLVNNAAWRTICSLRNLSLEDWEKTMRICITAPAFISKYAAQQMEKQGSGGVIINISSMMSDRPAGTSPAYIASKGALEALTKEIAITYGRSGIRVLCVKPGFIDTEMSHDYQTSEGEQISDKLGAYLNEATPLKSPGKPNDIANAVVWLSSEQASFMTGTTVTIDGGFTSSMNSYALKKLQFPNEF